MEFLHDRKSPKQRGGGDLILDKFKRNDDVFRKTMEEIFQKYSNLDDPGFDVCFETMTFRTPKGAVPLNSAAAESELQHLKSRVNAEHSLRVLESSRDEQSVLAQEMDVTQGTENINPFSQTENGDDSLGHGAETSKLSLNSVSVSQSCMWGESSQPEEEDQDLERTLSSHGSTLLDVYPSMLNQIGEAYRREQVTKAADAVLQRYRRRRWQSSQAQRQNRIPSNSLSHTLNKTMESSFAVQNLHSGTTSCHERMSSCQGAPPNRSNQELSPLKSIRNSPLASIRSNQELSPLKNIRNPSLASTRSNQELSPLNMRNPSLASTRSNQELSPLNIRNPSLASTRSNQELSPLNIRNPSLVSTRSNQELSPLKNIRKPSLVSTRSNQELSPLKNIRNPSLVSTRSNQELSPLKSIRNPSLASIRSSQELSQLKSIRNSSLASSACFYSPRRVHVEKSPVAESRTRQTGSYLQSDSEPHRRPVRVLDLSTASSSATSSCRSPSPDLNQTYIIQPAMMPPSCGIPASAVCSPNRSAYNSPLKGAKTLLFTSRGGRLVDASPSRRCHSQFTSAFVDRECCRDHLYSPTPSPHQAVIEGQCYSGKSPLKSRAFRLEHEEQTSSSIYNPKQTLPVNLADTTEVYRPPYQSKQRVSSSPCGSRHPLSEHQENLAMAQGHQLSPRPKRKRSFSSHQSTSSSVSHMSSRQIDAEFRRLYHHFICRGSSSSCPTSSCHLCERQSERDFQSPPIFSTSMSALALTPIRSRLKKRRRPSEVEEFLRQKRFRESCSTGLTYPEPKQQQQQQQLGTTYMSTPVANPSEEQHTWNRAVLLQCPSPGFLQARGSIRKVSGSAPSRQMHSHSSWRDATGCTGAAEARSPMSTWNQSGVSFSPSMSRRRLLYGPLQG